MFSMCGLLCRFLRGWRQSEAAGLITNAAALSNASLVIEGIVYPNNESSDSNSHSLFCQPFCEVNLPVIDSRKTQLMWRDNNKQAILIYPKKNVDLLRWTLFLSTSPLSIGIDYNQSMIGINARSCPTSASGSPLSSAVPSRRASAFTSSVTKESVITVLLEASHRNKDEESLYGYNVMVEQLAELYAWKSSDVFGIIIRTTPSKLMSMIRAYFNNALIVNDNLIIRKIITVDLVGEPSISNDPSTIFGSVTPGKWKYEKENLSQLEFSRSIAMVSSGLNSEVSNSNPNVSSGSSPFLRGIPISSSFTSSPYRRPHSTSSNSSPVKRRFCSQGKNSNDSCPASPLIEEEESPEPNRINMDLDTERPPNVLVYTANNHQYYESVKLTLENSFNKDRYVVYPLTDEMAFKSPWAGSTTLLVVCGDVPTHVSTFFIRYLLDGGRVLSICSDFLNVAVPLFGIVEVQEASVVSMSYNRWKNVQLLHHQHCFHSSPKHKRFSQNLDNKVSKSDSAVSVEPSYVEITDELGIYHRLDLEVLAKDDTWGAPSLLLANVRESRGKALFSQVHLEEDTKQSIAINLKGEQLKKCNRARLEILRDLLSCHLGLDTSSDHRSVEDPSLSPGYLLGRHELKHKFLEEIVAPFSIDGKLERNNLILHFLKENKTSLESTKQLMPVLLAGYPNHFSTLKYYEALTSHEIGRLAIYFDCISSTMNVLYGKIPLPSGMAVITARQLLGKGRHSNAWLSPVGCAMFSIQLHIPLASNLGQSVPFLQHLTSMAAVLAVKGEKGYEDLPLTLKWPNDIYVGSRLKIGGVLVDASTFKGNVIANIGCGINLSNSDPTSCINDVIKNFNRENDTNLREFDRETFIAKCFNRLEDLIRDFQTEGGARAVIDQYYKHWLHTGANVLVQNELGQTQPATITGVDQFGFLVARLQSGEDINLHPDGNSFNMMEGLIYMKTPSKR